jgi:sulfite reductase beta subunit-like hemoprotein
VATTLREGIQLRWRELLEVERVLEEIAAAEFDGENPAHPRERRVLAEGKEKLQELH